MDPVPELDPEPDSEPDSEPDPLFRGTDPGIRIRIRTKMSRISNTDRKVFIRQIKIAVSLLYIRIVTVVCIKGTVDLVAD